MVAIYLLYTVCAVDSCSFYFLLGLKNICHGPCVYLAGSLLATLLLFSSLYLSHSLLILLSAWVEHMWTPVIGPRTWPDYPPAVAH